MCSLSMQMMIYVIQLVYTQIKINYVAAPSHVLELRPVNRPISEVTKCPPNYLC